MDAVLGRLRRDRPGGPRGTRVLLACLGVAALIAIGLIAGRGAGHDDEADQAARGGAAGTTAAAAESSAAAVSEAAPASSAAAEVTYAAAESAAAVTAAIPEAPPAGRDLPVAPRIAQNGAITVRVAPADLDSTIDRIGQLAEGAGGYVAGTEADLTGPAGKGRAEVTVRVPRDRYARMVERFAGLGTVVGPRVDERRPHAGLRRHGEPAAARAARRGAPRRAARPGRDGEPGARGAGAARRRAAAHRDRPGPARQPHPRDRLRDDRGAPGDGQRPRRSPTVVKKDDDRPWGLRDALDDAAHNLASTVGALVRGVGIALPFAVIALAIWLAVRIVRRTSRRREEREEVPTPAAE